MSLSLLATADQLAELTGYKRISRQVEWLRSEGFIFRIGGDGRPKVLISEIECKMCQSYGKIQYKRPDINIDAIP